MSDFEIRVVDHSGEVLKELDAKIERILEAWGQQGVSYVKQVITEQSRVDTGAMRNSFSHQVDAGENTVYVGTNNEYALYHEYGTGIYADNGKGRQTPWVYQDAHGEWHRTRGMKPIHMIKNGIGNHVNDFKKIAEDELKK